MSDYSIVTPHAAVIIWNYRDRKGSSSIGVPSDEVDQVIVNTLSLKSINTSKSKASPAGQFEIRLAPTKNWVTAITPGSWLAILMSRQEINKENLKSGKKDSKQVKFFGRVDSVRVNVGVNQATGARMTEYIVSGRDWGSIFDSILYIDPSIRKPEEKNDPIAYQRLLYQKMISEITAGNLPTASQNIMALLKLWGSTDSLTESVEQLIAREVKPENNFTIPKEVKAYFGFSSTKLSDIINDGFTYGKLKERSFFSSNPVDQDDYEPTNEAVGLLPISSYFNQNNFWQLIQGASNDVLNETLCDLRWDFEGNNVDLALYHRIRPFAVNSNSDILSTRDDTNDTNTPDSKYITSIISRFSDLRRIDIPLVDVVAFNAGTNWRDKVNFIEMRVSPEVIKRNNNDAIDLQVRQRMQYSDKEAFTREGFRPIFAQGTMFPAPASTSDASSYDLLKFTDWKYLLKEWYFNTHKMLNGVISIIGQDRYIQVGDNIMVDAKVMGPSENHSLAQINNKGKAYLTAHVESVSHTFTVNDNGVREFFTNVAFSRGIITDINGKPFSSYSEDGGALEQDTKTLPPSEEKNNASTFGTSTDKDPDTKVTGW